MNSIDQYTLTGLESQLKELRTLLEKIYKDHPSEEFNSMWSQLLQILDANRNEVFDKEIYKELGELGLLGCTIKGYGCAGVNYVSYGLIAREVERIDSSYRSAFSVQSSLSMYAIYNFGSEEQKEELLPKMATGELVGCFCLTEPDAGSDVQSLKTEATKDGAEYVINGSKMWITGAGYADWFFVLGYTDRSAGYRGLSGFIVDADTPGVELGKKEENMGQRCSDTRGVTFNDVRIPEENLVGGVEGAGWMNAMKAFDHSRPSVSSHAVGNAQGAMEEAWAYAKERVTFGKPISQHQSISFMLADMATKIEAARLLTHSAASGLDKGERITLRAAHAKRFAADTCMEVTTDAVQVLGGYGYSEEYPLARRMRGAKIYQIFEGTSQIQRMIISRELEDSF